MKAFWNDCGNALPADRARTIALDEACRLWSDGRGVEGNFLGLIDDRDRTVQFYFEAGIPDEVEDARHLRIVLMDFPDVERKGSHTRLVTIGEVHGLIETAFRFGADPRHFGELSFTPW
ncbi:hypothetical protein [Methylobacterium brachythecii]|uniref:Uncharacterized protein n=1 Tax=Methylobacterium brachythecii TaxID=1176177 RepID=A0A7W6AFW0_9HYPH|nr:hypothetical protein [Methylobacterium brachythecii]MBB3900789.1 hypothetical protein [Methylobacterium brachythecii]GLS46401.1 hypothetical protein GCM10007884_43950 [Methylobacterium brachythecii]